MPAIAFPDVIIGSILGLSVLLVVTWLPLSSLITADLMMWEDIRVRRFALDGPESTLEDGTTEMSDEVSRNLALGGPERSRLQWHMRLKLLPYIPPMAFLTAAISSFFIGRYLLALVLDVVGIGLFLSVFIVPRVVLLLLMAITYAWTQKRIKRTQTNKQCERVSHHVHT